MSQLMAQHGSILFVDAYDSFSQNIAAILHQELSAKVTTIKIDTNVQNEFGCSLENFIQKFDAVVLGPGPGDPRHGVKDTGIFAEILDLSSAAVPHTPILGICLGFQVLCLKMGYQLRKLSMPCHGHSKRIVPIRKHPLFDGIDADNIFATCYNSLGVSLIQCSGDVDVSRPGSSSTNASFGSSTSISNVDANADNTDLDILAVDDDGYIMAIVHKTAPLLGVQFHPESCKSNISCQKLIKNWFQHVVKPCRSKQAATTAYHMHETASRRLFPDKNIEATYLAGPAESYTSQLIPEIDRAQALQALLHATRTSTTNVHYKQIKTRFSRKTISAIVHELNNSSTSMMLESTKKGRFSMYALLDSHVKLSQDVTTMMDIPEAPLVSYKDGRCKVLAQNAKKFRPSPSLEGKIARQDLIGALQDLLISKQATSGPGDIPFWGGFIGYMSYEQGLDNINVLAATGANRDVDDLKLLWVERSLVYDSLTSTVYIQTIRENDQCFVSSTLQKLGDLETRLQSFAPQPSNTLLDKAVSQVKIRLPDQQQYNNAYESCQEHLRAGNSYELCLTTEAEISLPALDQNLVFQLYQNMHGHNPVPYGAYMDFLDLTILSTSPEQFMSWDRTGQINMMPMKGTVKRSPSMTFARATEILSSPKESAENLMIADLIRHDLRTAVGYTSKVEVVKLCEVIEHETVYQMVSHIRAEAPIPPTSSKSTKQKLAMQYGIKALTTSLPPGSMTGAPKKRSCEILKDLEQRNRGVYSGVMGYFDVGGGGAWNVAIRTAFRFKDETKNNVDTWHVGAGGAITVLSNKEGEWEEMQTKLNSVLKGFTTVYKEEL